MRKTYLATSRRSALVANAGAGFGQPASSADLEPILPSDSHIRQCADTAVQASSVEVAQ
ncbi:hypothetical protein VNPA120661_68410 [Pseudomonas aeruginosa]|nr:hypothetical protein VNPA120661_68410 [Pseudomonas aeruginosa]